MRRALGCALRLRAPGQAMVFEDQICGPQRTLLREDSGDFVVRKKDGDYAYMFAVVVDDLAMGVTEVVRGDDLLGCTAQQLAVYAAIAEHVPVEALGGGSGPLAAPRLGPPPSWHHVPLVLGDDGRRLAKRNRSIHVRQLAADGVSPARLRRWLAESMGLPATGDLATLVAAWRERPAELPEAVRAAVVFTPAALAQTQ